MLAWLLAFTAHTMPVERIVMLQPEGPDRLHVLVHLKVPAGKQRAAFVASADENHDGHLSEGERRGLQRALFSRALDGLRVLVGTSTKTLDGLEVQLKVGRLSQDPTELMAHGTIALPPERVELTIATGAYGDKVALEIMRGTREVTRASRGSPRVGALSVELALRERVRVTLSAPSVR